MKKVFASIITIGDELLIGQVIDTNSAWMAQELNKAGIWVRRRVAVGDVWEEIWNALDEESKQADVILITGGLGPTADDITKPLLCEYFGGKMVVSPEALANVKHIFERVLNRPMIERNLKQAEVPDVCTVINNKRGTAPGMWFEKEGKIFVSMPGVPHEMKGMMTEYVIPRLPQYFPMPAIVSRTLLTAGIGESYLADRIKDFEEGLPSYIKLAYLPNYGMVRLRLTGTGETTESIGAEVQSLFDTLKKQVADVMVTDVDEPIESAVGKLLLGRHKFMSTAESCTGGFIAQLITSHPGSSRWFKGGVVSYANEVKTSILKVSPDTLAAAGAVSEATVREMITGVLAATDTDYAIAVSGIMGPGGGSPEKPVGMVWVAVGNRNTTIAQQFNFRFDRRRNIELTATFGLNLLRKFILEQEPAG
ncbi:MAG TPA: CinA family nicotinamide mononucleotide deamidase-related protein [Chitinophagaceae bacterium]|nr:CinA family nicotinamide mononucleotide deamidase-related protein [Chitinophagaceae bacterium]